ncbi:MAG TPA: cation diffusion facilitator family transporter [Desulfuromonadales bacterium]|nr:cation diffusion facilitator family transporter [Desulfuromonadales bacterium]
MTKPSPKIRAARFSIATAAALATLKLATGLATGSLAVISSAIDSLIDILMSGVNYLGIRQADQPADSRHPFGHGKFETMATLTQSLLIALSGGWIIFESVRRLLQGAALARLGEGMAVLLLSATVSWVLARFLRRVARETDSSALQADALHFAMDVYTNLALVIGLGAITFFDLPWLDPVLSLLVALYILYEAIRLVRHSLRDVLDEQLPETIRKEVEQLIRAHHEHLLDFHNLRTRRAGSQKIMDFHLTVCKHLSVEEAHAIADHLEKRIKQQIPGADVTIHIEPCLRPDCPGIAQCPVEKTRLEEPDSEAEKQME